MPLLAVYNPSGVASVDVASIIDGTYPRYWIDGEFIPAVDDGALVFRSDSGGADVGDSGASDYTWGQWTIDYGAEAGSLWLSSAGDAEIVLVRNNTGEDVDSVQGIAFEIEVQRLGSGSLQPFFKFGSNYLEATTANSYRSAIGGRATRRANHEIDFLTIFFDNGNIASGQLRVYGKEVTI